MGNPNLVASARALEGLRPTKRTGLAKLRGGKKTLGEKVRTFPPEKGTLH